MTVVSPTEGSVYVRCSHNSTMLVFDCDGPHEAAALYDDLVAGLECGTLTLKMQLKPIPPPQPIPPPEPKSLWSRLKGMWKS